MPVVAVLATRFSELPSPETLPAVDLEAHCLEILANVIGLVTRDNQIVPVDVRVVGIMRHDALVREVSRPSDPTRDNNDKKREGLDREGDCGSHRRELPENDLAVYIRELRSHAAACKKQLLELRSSLEQSLDMT